MGNTETRINTPSSQYPAVIAKMVETKRIAIRDIDDANANVLFNNFVHIAIYLIAGDFTETELSEFVYIKNSLDTLIARSLSDINEGTVAHPLNEQIALNSNRADAAFMKSIDGLLAKYIKTLESTVKTLKTLLPKLNLSWLTDPYVESEHDAKKNSSILPLFGPFDYAHSHDGHSIPINWAGKTVVKFSPMVGSNASSLLTDEIRSAINRNPFGKDVEAPNGITLKLADDIYATARPNPRMKETAVDQAILDDSNAVDRGLTALVNGIDELPVKVLGLFDISNDDWAGWYSGKADELDLPVYLDKKTVIDTLTFYSLGKK